MSNPQPESMSQFEFDFAVRSLNSEVLLMSILIRLSMISSMLVSIEICVLEDVLEGW